MVPYTPIIVYCFVCLTALTAHPRSAMKFKLSLGLGLGLGLGLCALISTVVISVVATLPADLGPLNGPWDNVSQ